ncbi:MAG: hypothetical protein ACRDMV_05375 [Streptosporangiales bacterium]
MSRACQRRKTTPDRLGAALAARKKIRWREPIQGALADVSDGAETPLELAYLRGVERGHGLPRGTRQGHRKIGARTQWIDVDYGDFRVRVELDGRIGHVDEGMFRDRARDNLSSEEGFLTLRYGWHETYADSCATAAQVATILGRRGWSGRSQPCNPFCPLG